MMQQCIDPISLRVCFRWSRVRNFVCAVLVLESPRSISRQFDCMTKIAAGEDRIPDLRIMRPTRCQLRYCRMCFLEGHWFWAPCALWSADCCMLSAAHAQKLDTTISTEGIVWACRAHCGAPTAACSASCMHTIYTQQLGQSGSNMHNPWNEHARTLPWPQINDCARNARDLDAECIWTKPATKTRHTINVIVCHGRAHKMHTRVLLQKRSTNT